MDKTVLRLMTMMGCSVFSWSLALLIAPEVMAQRHSSTAHPTTTLALAEGDSQLEAAAELSATEPEEVNFVGVSNLEPPPISAELLPLITAETFVSDFIEPGTVASAMVASATRQSAAWAWCWAWACMIVSLGNWVACCVWFCCCRRE